MHVVLFARIQNINQMVRYLLAFHIVFVQIFSRPDAHIPVHLPRVSADDFAADTVGQTGGQVGFAGSGGAEEDDQGRLGHGSKYFNKFTTSSIVNCHKAPFNGTLFGHAVGQAVREVALHRHGINPE